MQSFFCSNDQNRFWFCHKEINLHTEKKRFTSFPSPAGMSLTKLPLGRNNSGMTSLFPPRETLVVTSRLGTGNSRTFFYGACVACASVFDLTEVTKGHGKRGGGGGHSNKWIGTK